LPETKCVSEDEIIGLLVLSKWAIGAGPGLEGLDSLLVEITGKAALADKETKPPSLFNTLTQLDRCDIKEAKEIPLMAGKIKGLTKQERKALAEFEALLYKEFPRRLKRLILFGSKARGDSNRDSDLDLLVVISKNGKKVTREIAMLAHHPIAKYMVDISPIVVEERFFKTWSPLLAHINKEGITIWTNKKAAKNMSA
jgi:predicted nucleotidyltransferase